MAYVCELHVHVILLLGVTASVPVLVWHMPNFRMSFLLKVAGESTFESLDVPVRSLSNNSSSSI